MNRTKGQNSTFYNTAVMVEEEVRVGYLYKSPPSHMTKSLMAWKRRYFVLSKAGGNIYNLKYFKEENKREKFWKEINLYEISLLAQGPERHLNWEWIQRNFKCTPSCVLYLKVPDRDYFLIGANSDEMESWFTAIWEAWKTCQHTQNSHEENRTQRSQSDPPMLPSSNDDKGMQRDLRKKIDHTPSSPSARHSAPDIVYPTYNEGEELKPSQNSQKREDKEEGEQKQMETAENESDSDSSGYMSMRSVINIVQGDHTGDLRQQKKLETEDTHYKSVLLTGSKGSAGLSSQIPQQSQTLFPVKVDIYLSQEVLRKGVIFSQEAGKPRIYDCKHIQASTVLHKGDQILAINDLLTYSLEEVQAYLKRLSKEQVKLTILRQPGTRPSNSLCNVTSALY